MIDTVVFDFDGVILDTESADFSTWRDVFSAHGAELDIAYWVRHVGQGTSDLKVCAHLEELTGHGVDREQVSAARRESYLRKVHSQPLMPGVSDRLEEARALGLKLGVASSSSRGWVEGHLQRFGIRAMFGALKTAGDVSNVKPDPEVYRLVVAALGSSPRDTLAVEDSAHGVSAARGAGLHCLAVPNSITRHLSFREADLRVDSLEEITFAGLRARFARRDGCK